MFDITEKIFQECLQEVIEESLPEGSTEDERQALLHDLAQRWNFNPETFDHD